MSDRGAARTTSAATPAPAMAATPAPAGPGPWDSRSRALLPGEPPSEAPAAPAACAAPAAPAAPLAHTGRPAARRGPADPVKALLHRHRELCARAVDPLEIAAGLEAHGITDRTAARFRHRDVFSLAEELYARAPRTTADGISEPRPPEARTADARPPWAGPSGWGRWTALALLPGAVCSLTLLGLDHTGGQRRLAIGLAGALALAGALSACLRRGPLRAEGRTHPATSPCVYGLLACLLCGEGLLAALVSGGPDGPWPASPALLVAPAFAVLPAAWCAHLFSAGARRGLAGSRALADFAAVARPLLLTLVGLFAVALTGLYLLAAAVFGAAVSGEENGGAHGALAATPGGALAPTVALGTLLLLARLLTVHGFPGAAAAGLVAACAVELLSCASVLAGRLPGCEALAVPVRALAETWGAAAVPALACGAAALALLAHATVALSRASAHT
ncbi:hypothetical protein ACFRKB_04435 [Streptomyces scopuliridis]|uniref:hypothetical protein n=1 Tax=Streptomyces scopuliridis TaxID=452529 RepID=UPI0036B3E677